MKGYIFSSVTDDQVEDFAIVDCSECAKDIDVGDPAVLVPKPLGDGTYVALAVFCSVKCAEADAEAGSEDGD